MKVIQWAVPSFPLIVCSSRGQEMFFRETNGWCWDEALWTGRHVSSSEQVIISAPPNISANADVCVLSQELLAVWLDLSKQTGKVLLRCVAPGGSDEYPVWRVVRENIGRLAGICVLGGEKQRLRMQQWADAAGYRGTPVVAFATGAQVLPFEVPAAQRHGAVYLGRIIPEKRVDVVVRACAQAGVRLTICVEPSSLVGHDMDALCALVRELDSEVAFTSVGTLERTELLSRSRCVVTASHADAQWLPGTEARACGAVGIAERGTLIEEYNGTGLLYHDGTVEDVVRVVMEMHSERFQAEAERQRGAFFAAGLDSASSGKRFMDWIRGVLG